MTREEWHELVAAAHEAVALIPAGRSLPPVRWSTGYPPGTRGRGVAHVLPPDRSRDGSHWEVYISPTLAGPGRDGELAALTCGIAGAIAAGSAVPRPTCSADWSALMAKACAAGVEALELVGPYPSEGLLDPREAPTQGTRMLRLACSACGWLCRTTAKHLALIDEESHCPACASVGTLRA